MSGYAYQDIQDPLAGYMFQLDIPGYNNTTAFFASINGVSSENEVITRKVIYTPEGSGGAEPGGGIIKTPGRLTYGDVNLERGVTQEMNIWNWRQDVIRGYLSGHAEGGPPARQDCSITMFDSAGLPAALWWFFNAWPSQLTGPVIQAGGANYAIERLTIVHEWLGRVTIDTEAADARTVAITTD